MFLVEVVDTERKFLGIFGSIYARRLRMWSSFSFSALQSTRSVSLSRTYPLSWDGQSSLGFLVNPSLYANADQIPQVLGIQDQLIFFSRYILACKHRGRRWRLHSYAQLRCSELSTSGICLRKPLLHAAISIRRLDRSLLHGGLHCFLITWKQLPASSYMDLLLPTAHWNKSHQRWRSQISSVRIRHLQRLGPDSDGSARPWFVRFPWDRVLGTSLPRKFSAGSSAPQGLQLSTVWGLHTKRSLKPMLAACISSTALIFVWNSFWVATRWLSDLSSDSPGVKA